VSSSPETSAEPLAQRETLWYLSSFSKIGDSIYEN
jgi:hypothetical protein